MGPGGLYGSSSKMLDRFTFLADGQKRTLSQNIISALTHSFFKNNPLPYHEMRRGFIIGLGEEQWKPTLGHILPEILNKNFKLRMLASQNIDGLDHKVLSDKRKLYNPHGLMSTLVSEPMDLPLCVDINNPIYHRYVELVKTCIRDIYADLPARKGKSSHLWPGPEKSTPITLEMFGDLLPQSFHKARDEEKRKGTYSVKPGSVLFDRTLWRTTAAGEEYSAFEDVRNADLMFVMGTSLSGLTIDGMAHTAARLKIPIVVFDMTETPVQSIQEEGGWEDSRDCLLQGPMDMSILSLLRGMNWLGQLQDYLPLLCLNSLRNLRQFVVETEPRESAEAFLKQIDTSIANEVERERKFYDE